MSIEFEERNDKPSDHGHYQFKNLRASEKLTIQIVYWKKWRKLLKRNRLSKNQRAYVKLYFYELHARYYSTVVKGTSFHPCVDVPYMHGTLPGSLRRIEK